MTPPKSMWQAIFDTWESVDGHPYAVKFLISTLTRKDREIEDLKKQLANARRSLTNERKKK